MKLKKNVKIALGVIATVLVIALIVKLMPAGDSGSKPNGKESASENSNGSEASSDKNGQNENYQGENGQNEGGQNDQESGGGGNSSSKDNNGSGSNSGSSSGSSGKKQSGGKSASTTTKDTTVKLPYTIPDSSIVIESIQSYDGQYLEDGSDENVSGIAAAVIKNKGKNPVEYVDIEIKSGKTTYQFKGSVIASGASMVIQDANKAKYTGGSYSDCNAHIAPIDSFEMSKDVKVEVEESSLKVTNVSNSDIPCIRIFYKLYMEEQNAYIGGITYTSKITDLKAGDSISVTPAHYNKDYSKVMMVRTYDTAD